MSRLIDADAITRETFVNQVGENGGFISFEDAIDMLDNQPTVNEWIPVSERLPEENEVALVVYRNRIDGIGVTEKHIDINNTFCGLSKMESGGWTIEDILACKVVAWMPIPEYRGGK